jgi:hypothetical protein
MADTDEKPDPIQKILTGLLDGYSPKYITEKADLDILLDRFKILLKKPLPELNHELGQAFAATDSQNDDRTIYGLILNTKQPYRIKLAEVFTGINQPNTQSILGAGRLTLSEDQKKCQVLFLEKPAGKKLSTILNTGQPIHEHQVIDLVLNPMSRALAQYADKGMVHGNLNPDSVYLGEATFLAEAASSPCGYFQHDLYEPLERNMAQPKTRGLIDSRGDIYALAMLSFEMMYGLDHVRKLSSQDYIREALNIGTYHLLSHNLDLSDNMSDFFRGAMSDNLDERWGMEQFQQWLGGKRYNMIMPPAPKDATRSITFMETEFFSRRSLAHAFHKNWRATLKEIWDLRIDRWIEMSMHRPDLADQADRVLRIGGRSSTGKHNSDMLTKLISLLDPIGPIRTQHLSLRPEGLGLMLASLFQQDAPAEMRELVDVIENDLPNYWAYLSDSQKSQELSQILWKVQRVKNYTRFKGLGFGIERLLYEFNDTICCQSPMLKNFNALNIQDALQALDTLAPKLGKNTSLTDRHLAAFLACKLDIGKQIKIQDVSMIPALANNAELTCLRIIARAQQKLDKDRYVGLASWVAIRVETMLDCVHNRTLRKKLKARLKGAAASGNINEVLGILINREVLQKDLDSFNRTLQQYYKNQQQIKSLEDSNRIGRLSQVLGSKISSIIGYIILVGSFYYIIGTM